MSVLPKLRHYQRVDLDTMLAYVEISWPALHEAVSHGARSKQ